MDRKKKVCLVFEGGGVGCAYQFGVLKRLEELFGSADCAVRALCGGEPGGAVGSSFGALGAAVFAAEGTAGLEELWKSVRAESLFRDPVLREAADAVLRGGFLLDPASLLGEKKTRSPGISRLRELSARYYEFVMKNTKEERIRQSGLDYGLTAVRIAVSEAGEERRTIRVKGLAELFAEDVEEGRLPEYTAASAAFPAFGPRFIDGNAFLDGSILDNTPVGMAERRGFGGVLLLRTGTYPPKKRWTDAVSLFSFTPSRPLPASGVFSSEDVPGIIDVGRLDAERAAERLG